MQRVKLIALGSIGIGCVVLALKAGAAWMTGSSALYSDALESVVNVVASAVAAAALFYATRPADKNHPYGHDKAEFFAAVIVGVLIIVAALSIFRNAYATWRHPELLRSPGLGLALNAVATTINAGWAVLLGAAGRQSRSTALQADSRHLWTDVATSIGVLVGVAAVFATGLLWVDVAVAIAVGVNVLWSGWEVMRQSVGGLMDEAPGEEVMDRTRELLNRSRRRGDRGPRSSHAHHRPHDLPGISPRRARRHAGRGGTYDLRPGRGGAEGGDPRPRGDHPCGARGQAKHSGVLVL